MTVIDIPPSPGYPEVRSTMHRGIPFGRIVTTELRKMLDTRSGFWLMASVGILALFASAAVILFAPLGRFTYGSFTTAVGIPLSLVLPMIAILSVTSEWSQRTGLATFTLVPRRGRVIAAKAASCIVVAVASMPLVFGIGALGNLIGSAVAGASPVWDVTATNLLTIVLANVLSVLFGFMLGVLTRHSVGALVAYVIYQFLLPALALFLSASQGWFRGLRPWLDFDFAQQPLFDQALTAQQWAHLAVTGMGWLVIPLMIGLRSVRRAEVK
jgi:ABC-2 type transport system permease protein